MTETMKSWGPMGGVSEQNGPQFARKECSDSEWVTLEPPISKKDDPMDPQPRSMPLKLKRLNEIFLHG